MNLFARSYQETVRSFISLHCREQAELLILSEDQTGIKSLQQLDQITNISEKTDFLLDDALTQAEDVWELFRALSLRFEKDHRLFIAHTSYLWSPLLGLWRKLFHKNSKPLSWFSPSDIENLLSINGFEIVSRDHGLLLPFYIPGLHWFFNVFLAHLPWVKALDLIQFYTVRKIPDFKPLKIEELPYTVSLIIPTKDECGNIAPCFEKMPQLGKITELVFVDGNSKDGTVAEIERCAKLYGNRFSVQILRQEKLDGKGSAVRQGFDAATGDLLFVFDSDITVRCEDLPKFVLALAEKQAEFVMGSRLVYPMEDEAMRTLNIIANKVFSLIFSWLLDRPIKDTLCGTKGTFRNYYQWIKQGRSYFGDFDPFGDFDLIFGAARRNLKIVEVPIRYRNRTYGEIKISRFTHGWLLLKMTWIAARKLKFN